MNHGDELLPGATGLRRASLGIGLALVGLVPALALASCTSNPHVHADPKGHEASMTIDQLDAPARTVELAAGENDAGTFRLREELETYLRGRFRVIAQRTFNARGTGWVELDSHVANALGRKQGFEKQDVPWRRPGKDLFSIYRTADGAIAVGMVRGQEPGDLALAGYFQLEAAAR